MSMEKQDHYTAWIPGVIHPNGVFERVPWSPSQRNRSQAVSVAQDHARDGQELLNKWGVEDAKIVPAVRKRYTYHEYLEVEDVSGEEVPEIEAVQF